MQQKIPHVHITDALALCIYSINRQQKSVSSLKSPSNCYKEMHYCCLTRHTSVGISLGLVFTEAVNFAGTFRHLLENGKKKKVKYPPDPRPRCPHAPVQTIQEPFLDFQK